MKRIRSCLKGHWHILKGHLKQKFGQLTDDDLLYNNGKEEELIGRLQKRLGKTRAEINRILSDSVQTSMRQRPS